MEVGTTVGVAFGSALLGSVAGFLGALELERRREARQNKTTVAAILLELALLSATLHTLVHDREIRRADLTLSAWERFGPELVHLLPMSLVKTLHLYIDGFENVRRTYTLLKGTVHMAYAPYLLATALSWAASVDRLSQLVSSYRSTGKFGIDAGESEQDQVKAILADVQGHALAELKKAELPTDSALSLSDDFDLSVPPEGWTPRNVAKTNHEEVTQS